MAGDRPEVPHPVLAGARPTGPLGVDGPDYGPQSPRVRSSGAPAQEDRLPFPTPQGARGDEAWERGHRARPDRHGLLRVSRRGVDQSARRRAAARRISLEGERLGCRGVRSFPGQRNRNHERRRSVADDLSCPNRVMTARRSSWMSRRSRSDQRRSRPVLRNGGGSTSEVDRRGTDEYRIIDRNSDPTIADLTLDEHGHIAQLALSAEDARRPGSPDDAQAAYVARYQDRAAEPQLPDVPTVRTADRADLDQLDNRPGVCGAAVGP